jgi:hypothetical protein
MTPSEQPQKTEKSSTGEFWFSKYGKNEMDIFLILQSEIQSEHNLIANRMTWYVTSQSFLMAAFAISGGKDYSFKWLANHFIPCLGLATSLVTFI